MLGRVTEHHRYCVTPRSAVALAVVPAYEAPRRALTLSHVFIVILSPTARAMPSPHTKEVAELRVAGRDETETKKSRLRYR